MYMYSSPAGALRGEGVEFPVSHALYKSFYRHAAKVFFASFYFG